MEPISSLGTERIRPKPTNLTMTLSGFFWSILFSRLHTSQSHTADIYTKPRKKTVAGCVNSSG